MSEPATAQRPTLVIEYLDPSTLLTDANVRLDLRLDKDFVASIKTHGVLVPLVALRTAEGAVRVRHGHRRTMGAIEAGVDAIPVMIVGDEGTDTAAQIERVVTQFVENHHREGFTSAEEVGIVATLLDLGLTAGQIQRQTKMKKAAVTAAVAIAGSDLAKAATVRYDFLTLDQAAAVAEFEDDTEAVKVLVAAAQAGEVRFEHTLVELRETQVARAAEREARQALEAEGITVLDVKVPWTSQLSYLTDDQGEELTVETHRACPGHAAYLNLDWIEDATAATAETDDGEEPEDNYRPVWVPIYVCTAPEANGHRCPAASRSASTERPAVDPEVAKEERRRVITNNKAWRSAEEVRREWLTTFLSRKSPPKGALRYVLGEFALAHWRLCNKIGQGHELACKLLSIDGGREGLAQSMASATDNRAQVIALALVLGAYEDFTSVETWRNPTPQDRDYLNVLVEWGYQLSDIEASIFPQQEEAS